MDGVVRKGIAFEPGLLSEFDSLIGRKGYKNRSEAIRDLIRDALIDERSENPSSRMMGTLTIVYNHHEHGVQHELTHAQHDHTGLVRSTLHVHMDNEMCLEVLVLEGVVSDIHALADAILAMKGVKHGKLVLSG